MRLPIASMSRQTKRPLSFVHRLRGGESHRMAVRGGSEEGAFVAPSFSRTDSWRPCVEAGPRGTDRVLRSCPPSFHISPDDTMDTEKKYTEDSHTKRILERVLAKAGLAGIEEVTAQAIYRIEKLAAEREIPLEELAVLIKAVPDFVDLQKETIHGLLEVLSQVAANQEICAEAIRTSLERQYDILEVLARSAETDETRLKIAQSMREVGEEALRIERMNRDNNGLGWRIVGGIVVIALSVVAILARGSKQ